MAASKRSAKGRAGVPAGAARSADAAPESDPEISRLERLLALMHEHGLMELEVGADGRSVRLCKTAAFAPAPASAPPPAAASAAPAAGGGPAAGKAAANTEPFLSPMVGTFYRASSPEAKAFVMEGDLVKPDTVLCIIEAMKVMNEVRAERTGRIVQILVENGEAVEYGQPLFVIQRT